MSFAASPTAIHDGDIQGTGTGNKRGSNHSNHQRGDALKGPPGGGDVPPRGSHFGASLHLKQKWGRHTRRQCFGRLSRGTPAGPTPNASSGSRFRCTAHCRTHELPTMDPFPARHTQAIRGQRHERQEGLLKKKNLQSFFLKAKAPEPIGCNKFCGKRSLSPM